jgi:hypothetical protein
MIDTGLVLIDGIAGSGKTTTAQWLYLALTNAGVDARWVTEAQKDHPVFQREIEEAPTTDEAIERVLGSWRKFARDAAARPRVTVMDGSIFDSQIAFLLLRDTPSQHIGVVVTDIVDALKILRPVFFYLYQDNVDEAIEKICGRRGDDWRRHVVAYVAASPFARNRHLSGMEAVRAYYSEFRRISDVLFARLDIQKTAISTSGDRWAEYRARILESLDATSAVRVSADAIDLSALAGEYLDAEHGRRWRVVFTDGALFLDGMKLLHIDGNRFFIEGQPIELTFEPARPAPAQKVHYFSRARDGLKSELTWVRA